MTSQTPPDDTPPQSAQDAPGPEAAEGVNLRSVRTHDWALLALGLATLIFSCFDVYHFSSNYAGSRGFSAWHDIAGAGFFGWFGVVLPVLASVVLALDLFEPGATFPMSARLIAVYGWGAGFVSELLAIALHPKFYDRTYSDGTHGSLGHGVSFWIIVVLTLVGSGVALLGAQRTDTALPGPLKNIPKIGP